MCRYALGIYKTSWVCVPCRYVAQGDPRDVMHCPFCRTECVNAGRDFKAPRKRSDSRWFAVAAVLASGRNYDSCGCTGPGPRPHTKAEVRRAQL